MFLPKRFVLGQYLRADPTINRAETAVPSGGCDLCEPIGARPLPAAAAIRMLMMDLARYPADAQWAADK